MKTEFTRLQEEIGPLLGRLKTLEERFAELQGRL
jgi:hypothetical protein